MHVGTTTSREVFKGWQLPAKRQGLGVAIALSAQTSCWCHHHAACSHLS